SSSRHTSFSRDWSSDVCSSDLRRDRRQRGLHRSACPAERAAAGRLVPANPAAWDRKRPAPTPSATRPECRTRLFSIRVLVPFFQIGTVSCLEKCFEFQVLFL